MKKSMKTLVFLLLAVPIVFIGCKKSDMTDNTLNSKEDALKSIAYCGSTTTGILYDYWDTEHTQYGTVTVGNDADNLYVTYNLAPGWTLLPFGEEYYDGCYLIVGSQAEIEAFDPTGNYNINPSDFTGHFHFTAFPYKSSPTPAGLTTYQFTVPRSQITVDCPMIVAFAGITNGTINNYVSARSSFKGMGYWFTHCMQNCPVISCNTAYAKGDDGVIANCFYNDPISLSNWGWSNYITATTGNFSWPIYAGNPSCDALHDPIGWFTGSYDGTTLKVTYNLNDGFTLDESHLWVGTPATNDHPYLPWNSKKKVYVANPGGYTYNNVFTEGVEWSHAYSGPLYLAAHAKVCGEYAW